MPSSLTWIDHDAEARERSMRILALFQERESRDELGLGAVRDFFADTLFPGTSTIQTRLRYMLFVPWVYRALEAQRIPASRFAAISREMEMALISPLMNSDDSAGVFGGRVGEGLKRLPSSVYWNGLGAWGIRRIPLSQDEYHRHIERIYQLRTEEHARYDKDGSPSPEAITWHPRTPNPPQGFPDNVSQLGFGLTTEEAGFLLDRILDSQGGSLLAFLARECEPAECQFPWEHPDRASFCEKHNTLLDYGELFSTAMHGAAFLYNLMLAEEAGRDGTEAEHRSSLAGWREAMKRVHRPNLPVDGLWGLTADSMHTITQRTREFVAAWFRRVRAVGGRVEDDAECRLLVRRRERQLKGPRSRFVNLRARDQWSGYAGVGQMDYRWRNVKVLLHDLREGLKGDDHARP